MKVNVAVWSSVGDIRRLSCEVNTHTQELTYWVEGQKAATVTIPLLTHEGCTADAPLPPSEPVFEPEPVTDLPPVPERKHGKAGSKRRTHDD